MFLGEMHVTVLCVMMVNNEFFGVGLTVNVNANQPNPQQR